MSQRTRPRNIFRLAIVLLAGQWMVFSVPSIAQEEVTSSLHRYKQYEVSTGYYEQYEAAPQHQRPLVKIPGFRQGMFPYRSAGVTVRNRSHLPDSHWGVRFYSGRGCVECHPEQARDIHTTRAGLTCRQCHGAEPIASLSHYYSPFNPIRRHAYVCAKCHEGASASFATYVVHAPVPGSSVAKREFTPYYYAYWFMLILLAGTLIFFIPHSILVGLRELFNTKKGGNGS